MRRFVRRERRGFLIGLLVLAATSLAWGGSAQGETDLARRQKARYYFLQGSLEASRQEMAKAYEYFKRAYELDPGYGDAGFTYGSQRLFLRTDTMQSEPELLRSLRMMQEYVDANPRDLYATQLYGYLTTALDTVEESVRVYENTYNILPGETQLLQAMADAYMRRMEPGKAIEALERYEGIEGKSKDISLKKITFKLADKDTVGALQEADLLIEAHPGDPYARILKGNLYEVVGNMDSVVKAYKEAEALAPENGAVKMSLAQYYRATGDSVMLDNMVYSALLSEDLELEDKLGILGDYLQKLLDEEGDRKRGDHLFSVLQSQYLHEPQVLEMSARYEAAKGDYAAAGEAIGYAIDVDPTNENYWLMLVSFDMMDKNYEGAVKNYNKAKEYLEPSQSLKNLYSASASMLEDSQEAERIIRELLSEPPLGLTEDDDTLRHRLDYEGLQWASSLYCILGDIYYKRGEADKAFAEYEKSLYFLPDNALTLNNYAYFLSEEGRELEKAKKMSHRVLELVDNNPTYLDTYAWILYKIGEYENALTFMEEALQMAEEQGDDNEEYHTHFEAIKGAIEGLKKD
ncbi:MAG: hypothetical protein J1D77_03315 [Muribaculaceae bacterium]|nr:hypothetical protein [Muribaculaceae bacterium]